MNSHTLTHFFSIVATVSMLALSVHSDTYTWLEDATAPWASTISWNPMGVPAAGDFVEMLGVSTANISGVCTVGGMLLGKAKFEGAEPGDTLMLDMGDGSQSEIGAWSNVVFGAVVNDPNLVLNLQNSALFRTYNVFNETTSMTFSFHAKITGGSEEAPVDLTFTKSGTGWTQGQYFITNPGNDFRGDINVVNFGSESQLRLMFGYGETGATDSMLGHPDNVVRMTSGTLYWHRNDSIGIRHRVEGNGTIIGTNYDPAWNTFKDGSLTLGDGFVLSPGTETAPFSSFTARSKKDTLSIHPNATFEMDVSPTKCDVITFDVDRPFSFTGRVVMREVEPVSPNTTWTIMKITKGATTALWEPSSIPDDYSFTITGNNTDGWIITATKLMPGANVSTLYSKDVGDTYATMCAEITSIIPAGPVILRTYYGTTDGGDNPNAWDTVIEYPSTNLVRGTYDIPVNDLVLGTTYYVRHSVENSVGENFAPESFSFTTQIWETPDIFTWNTIADVWSADVWSIDTVYARHVPGLPGDVIRFQLGGEAWNDVGISPVVDIDDDVTIGTIQIWKGPNASIQFTASTKPVTLTFDTGSSEGLNYIGCFGQMKGLSFGRSLDDQLSIELAQPIHVDWTTAYDHNLNLYAPISGGSVDAPTSIRVDSQGDEYCNVYVNLMNEANSWFGDFYLGTREDHKSTTELRVGNANLPSVNSMLGNPANAIILGNRATVRFYAPAETAFDLEREIRGTGTIYGSINNNALGTLHLTDSARIAPHGKASETDFGSLALRAASFAFEPGATIALDLGVEGNDTFVLESTSDLTIGCLFELTPEDPLALPGTTWTLGTVTKAPSLSLNGLKSPGFRVYAVQDLETTTPTWTLYAEKLPMGTLLILR